MKRIAQFCNDILFFFAVKFGKIIGSKHTGINLKNKLTERQVFEKKQRDRYLMNSLLKEGDSYAMGSEATVTLAKFGVEGKEEVKKKIAAADERRAAKMAAQRERAIGIMLMKPEELLAMQTEEWFAKRKKYKEEQQKISSIAGLPEVEPPSGELGKHS